MTVAQPRSVIAVHSLNVLPPDFFLTGATLNLCPKQSITKPFIFLKLYLCHHTNPWFILDIFLTVLKYMEQKLCCFSHVVVYSSVALSPFILLCTHHCGLKYRLTKVFIFPHLNFILIKDSPSPASSFPGNLQVLEHRKFCFYEFDCSPYLIILESHIYHAKLAYLS